MGVINNYFQLLFNYIIYMYICTFQISYELQLLKIIIVS